MVEEIKDVTNQATAIPPSFTLDNVNESVASEVSVAKDTSGEDIAALKLHAGWKEVEAYIDHRIKELTDFDIANLTVEEIGYRYALTSALRMELNNIKDIVELNYEHEKRKADKGTEGTK